MIASLIVLGYLVGWFTAAVVAMRALADRMDRCGGYSCIHFGSHWRGDGSVGGREAWSGAVVALAWPILWLPAAAFLVANRRPTPRALEADIARLEREAGIR